jgi:predicted PurR-regulated permease PerM
VLLIVAVIALIWLGYLMRAVTVPLLVALLLAYLFEPLVSRLSAHPKLNRPVVVGGLLCSVGVVFLLVMVIVTSAVVSQTTRFIDEIREGRFQERVALMRDYIPDEHRERTDEWFEWLFGPPEEEDRDSADQPDDMADDEAPVGEDEAEDDAAAAGRGRG